MYKVHSNGNRIDSLMSWNRHLEYKKKQQQKLPILNELLSKNFLINFALVTLQCKKSLSRIIQLFL